MLNDRQKSLCSQSTWDFFDLRALFINCTLKPSPQQSHTQGLVDVVVAIMRKNGIHTEIVRAVDFELAPGVYADMTEQGFERDDWPQIYEKVEAAEILAGC